MASLAIMVGGEEAPFRHAKPLLSALGSVVVRVGGPGAGQAAKLCNNLVAGVAMAALAEACAVAEREGIEARALYGVLCASTGDSRVLRNRFPIGGIDAAHPSSHGFASLFALDLLVKDLALACDLAREHGVEPTMAATALEQYCRAQQRGLGALDYSVLHVSK